VQSFAKTATAYALPALGDGEPTAEEFDNSGPGDGDSFQFYPDDGA
jgi:hypothetical protein